MGAECVGGVGGEGGEEDGAFAREEAGELCGWRALGGGRDGDGDAGRGDVRPGGVGRLRRRPWLWVRIEGGGGRQCREGDGVRVRGKNLFAAGKLFFLSAYLVEGDVGNAEAGRGGRSVWDGGKNVRGSDLQTGLNSAMELFGQEGAWEVERMAASNWGWQTAIDS